jgi:hypothetical protein
MAAPPGTALAKGQAALTQEKAMRKLMSTLVLSASFVGVPAMVGCDRTVSHEETVTKSPTGSTKVKEETVTKKADGSIEKKTETNKVP